MTKNTSIVLSEHFQSFIAEQVEEGRYGSASEVVRAGLRLLEDREMRLSRLRAALLEGEQSGMAEEFDLDAFIAEKAREEGLEE
ncbi:type II toxin-antitoxin system ParD family antitoxin [Caulobacter sp.]|uniref:type II toxin-antitoxin system ParD family antitoxin n=1 Tax=Caulobacter sp. TaxID=78 RepID=UPI001B00DBE1|nr:type II toxin-antitoxin system ParD family antitoxin [Caulobacter sp.]MBO9543329.1 type II toxin-antitoxin system ParD family antitoxin [Caulobacter sp.]